MHPHKHAWCEGRVHVPRDLHFELLDALGTQPGESPSAKAGRLIAFYAATMAAIPPTQDLDTKNGYKFWNHAFETWRAREEPRDVVVAPSEVRLSAREIEAATRFRSQIYGGCPHDPRCEDWKACVREIALARKVAAS